MATRRASKSTGATTTDNSTQTGNSVEFTKRTETIKKLSCLVDSVNRSCKAPSIVRAGVPELSLKYLSCGVPEINEILGNGFVRGRVHEIYGHEGTGKTSLCLHTVNQVQSEGGIAVWIDADHNFNPAYARSLGVYLDDLLLVRAPNGETAFDIVLELVKSRLIDLIVVDSIAALASHVELDGDLKDNFAGAHAVLVSKALKQLMTVYNATGSQTTVLLTNQLRMRIGVAYGNPEIPTGGLALKNYAASRLDLRRIQTLKRGADEYGVVVKAKVMKSKHSKPYLHTEIPLLFGEGFQSAVCEEPVILHPRAIEGSVLGEFF